MTDTKKLKCIACCQPLGALKAIQRLVDEQANEGALWRNHANERTVEGLMKRPLNKCEGRLQEALRELHARVEDWSEA